MTPPPLTADELEAVPLFPLPNCVLLPGSILPLHVFEERYREMTRDALAGNGIIAVARLQPGYESDYEHRPPIYACCGVGRIIASEELPDGRFHLILRGVARIEIDHEHPAERAYRIARARLIADDVAPAEAGCVARAHEQLVAICDRLAQSMERGGEELRQLVRVDPRPAMCADIVVAALLRNVDQRQAHLETYAAMDRIKRAIDCVSHLVCENCTPTDLPN